MCLFLWLNNIVSGAFSSLLEEPGERASELRDLLDKEVFGGLVVSLGPDILRHFLAPDVLARVLKDRIFMSALPDLGPVLVVGLDSGVSEVQISVAEFARD